MHTAEWGALVTAHFDPSAVMMSDRPPVFAPAEAFALLYQAEGDLLDLKYRAMLRQESQVGPMLARLGEENYRFMLAEEGFLSAAYNPRVG
jgi:hypothetical protein